MWWTAVRWTVLAAATLPLVYYLLAIYSALRFFRSRQEPDKGFTPPVSILKPVRGLDREAYENFATFCRLDYPEYEVLFSVADEDDPAILVIQKLIHDFPERPIRLLIGFDNLGPSSKASKLCRLVREAQYDLLVISDSDIRVDTDYLRKVVSPFRGPQVGGVTCLYLGRTDERVGSQLESIGLTSDFHAGVLVARQLEGVKFTLGATMATRRERLAEIGGFEALVDYCSDDFELGKRIAAHGYRVELAPCTVWTDCSGQTLRAFFKHQLRWGVSTRHSRPRGYFGLLLTQGLPWSLAAAALAPSAGVGLAYLTAYLSLRLAMAWTVGVWGLHDPLLRRRLWLVPLRDALAFVIWLASLFSNRIQWRGTEFCLDKGRLVPVASARVAVDELHLPD